MPPLLLPWAPGRFRGFFIQVGSLGEHQVWEEGQKLGAARGQLEMEATNEKNSRKRSKKVLFGRGMTMFCRLLFFRTFHFYNLTAF